MKCEYEVSEEAVKSYKKYHPYEEWNLDGSEEKGRMFRKSMKGCYLKLDDNYKITIVGDVLTSNRVWGNARKRENAEILNALNLFENIYHTNGNYIPIPEIEKVRTANLSGNNCDTFTHHLNVCKQAIERTLKSYKAWQIWSEEIWIPYCVKENCDNPWDKFLEEYYLRDFVDKNKYPISFVVGRELSNHVGIKAQDNDETVLNTINECIDLIIRRNFRIEKNIKTSFDINQENDYIIYKQSFR